MKPSPRSLPALPLLLALLAPGCAWIGGDLADEARNKSNELGLEVVSESGWDACAEAVGLQIELAARHIDRQAEVELVIEGLVAATKTVTVSSAGTAGRIDVEFRDLDLPEVGGPLAVSIRVRIDGGAVDELALDVTVVAAPDVWPDLDEDGYGNGEPFPACVPPPAAADNADDCDDGNPAVNPGAADICNGIDDDCDGLDPLEADEDGDGALLCGDPLDIDCDDNDALRSPAFQEVAGNDIDENCDDIWVCVQDSDGDLYGEAGGSTVNVEGESCSDAGGPDNADDCDDGDPTVNPGASEIPLDGIDNDCNGLDSCHPDDDADGYGATGTFVDADVTSPACSDLGVTLDDADCDDTNALVNPAGTEVVGDDLDEDCDGTYACFLDSDVDGFGAIVGSVPSTSMCSAGGFPMMGGDCDDDESGVNPGVAEVVGDGIDNDCDGFELCYTDGDDDGFAGPNTAPSSDFSCSEDDLSPTADDCDDTDPNIFPGGTEVVGSGVDEDCDTFEICYDDFDEDGVATNGTHSILGLDCDAAPGSSSTPDFPIDCNDNDATVNPNAAEICDGVDTDCDQSVPADELDDDGDTYVECTGVGPLTGLGDDCDDSIVTIYPTAPELCDGLDNDCNTTADDNPLQFHLAGSTLGSNTLTDLLGSALQDGAQINVCGSGTPQGRVPLLHTGEVSIIGNGANPVFDGALELIGTGLVNVRTLTLTGSSGLGSTDGGIVNVASSVSLAVSNSTLNCAQGLSIRDGGAIYANGSVELTDVLVQGCSANSRGGAIYTSESLLLDPTVSFIDNDSADNGGAIYVTGTSPGSTAGATFQGNDGRRGGAIYLDNTAFEVHQSQFTTNSAAERGGAIYAAADDAVIMHSTFDGNDASVGGALLLDGANGIIDVNTFTNNLANRGAAVMVNQQGTHNFRWSTFDGNGDGSTSRGGAIETLGDLILDDSRFTQNVAALGGAISIDSFGETTCICCDYGLVGQNENQSPSIVAENTVLGALVWQDPLITYTGTFENQLCEPKPVGDTADTGGATAPPPCVATGSACSLATPPTPPPL